MKILPIMPIIEGRRKLDNYTTTKADEGLEFVVATMCLQMPNSNRDGTVLT